MFRFGYFPLPRPHEILYSTVARCRTYLALSNGCFTKIVLGRPVAATINPDKYVSSVSSILGKEYSTSYLINNHSLKPLVQLFGNPRKEKRLRQFLRFCPECIKDQRQTYGEAYWHRDWQIKEARLCLKHGCPLIRTPIPAGTNMKGYGFFNLELALNLTDNRQETVSPKDFEILHEAVDLLNCCNDFPELSEADWERFYRRHIPDLSKERDGRLYSVYLYERIESYWGADWLKRHNLLTITRSNYCVFEHPDWLYHLVLIKANCPNLSLKDAVRQALIATN